MRLYSRYVWPINSSRRLQAGFPMIDSTRISSRTISSRTGLWRLLSGSLVGGMLVLGLSACEGSKAVYPDRGPGMKKDREMVDPANPGPRDSLLGPDGLNIFGGGGSSRNDGSSGGGVGVNSFLWRASLDTVAFMPLSSADPFGGVILTDWYSPENPEERFKANVYIMSKQLRADGVKVSVFRQVRNKKGEWADANVSPGTVTELENTILTRARQIRLATLN